MKTKQITDLRAELEGYRLPGRLEHVDLNLVKTAIEQRHGALQRQLPHAIIIDVGHNPDAIVKPPRLRLLT